jgi:hypothetical protein
VVYLWAHRKKDTAPSWRGKATKVLHRLESVTRPAKPSSRDLPKFPMASCMAGPTNDRLL